MVLAAIVGIGTILYLVRNRSSLLPDAFLGLTIAAVVITLWISNKIGWLWKYRPRDATFGRVLSSFLAIALLVSSSAAFVGVQPYANAKSNVVAAVSNLGGDTSTPSTTISPVTTSAITTTANTLTVAEPTTIIPSTTVVSAIVNPTTSITTPKTSVIPTTSVVPKPGSSSILVGVSFANIDQYALNTPKSAEISINSLASYLSQGAKNDLEKTRAIYRWITQNISYDYQAYLTHNYGDTGAQGVLNSRKSICDGYSELFLKIAQASGLQASKITGWAKGIGYSAGDSITGTTNHAWNAVYLNDGWYLIDSTWGAGSIANGQFVREFKDYYFLTPPSQFIYHHLPEYPQWQLLNISVTTAEFAGFPFAAPAYFKNNLELVSHPGNVISTNGNLVISIKAPLDVMMSVTMESSGILLARQLTFVQREGNLYQIQAVFPSTGNYTLHIFAKNIIDSGNAKWALDYTIKVTAGSPGLIGFPMTYSNYGDTYLYAPLTYYLPAGTRQHFKLDVPGAASVFVVVGGNWVYFIKNGSTFEADVTIVKGENIIYTGNSSLLSYFGQ